LNLNDNLLKELGDFNFSNTYTITADTEKFEISNMIFAVLPLSAIETEFKNTLPQTVSEVKATLTKVQTIIDKFNSLNLNQLMNTLFTNTEKITQLTSSISDVTKIYNDNKALIAVIEKYLTEENIKSIKKLAEDSKDLKLDELSKILSSPVFQLFIKQLPDIAKDIQTLSPVAQGLEKDLSDPAVQKALNNLPQTLETIKKLKGQLDANQELFNTLEKSLDSETISGIQELMKSLDGMISDDTVEKYVSLVNDADNLVARVREWVKIGQQYNVFTKAGKNAKTSVMFVYETASINAPAEKKKTVQNTTQEENAIKAWFKKTFGKNDN
ncbi:MAG: hypothetical protein KBT46_07420, partial [Ruminococcus sp.]|nr:hypothetical protein [Candidatus Copronaster equi]